jgi:peptidoglycan hydrolase-like protein with peptidoglycan-binding domain
VIIAIVVVLVLAAGGATAFALSRSDSDATNTASAKNVAAGAPVTDAPTTTTTRPKPTTTTTTIPAVKQPTDMKMPDPGRLGYGSQGPIVGMYEQRMKDLHFDPGPVDGVFDQRTQYAVVAVQKYVGQERTGVIDRAVQLVLSHFVYTQAEAKSEPDRVEIDLDRQVLQVFQNWQPILVTTTSTGSGEHFCGGADGCQYAITPTGHYHFYERHDGWLEGKLGKMYKPYFFNGGIAVHGLASVPAYPASHGCARIPMHIAEYFNSLVHQGESVFVVGTAKKAGNGYVGPVMTNPKPATTPTTVKPTSPTTAKKPATTPTTLHVTGTTKPTATSVPVKKGP